MWDPTEIILNLVFINIFFIEQDDRKYIHKLCRWY